jgi:two-component system, OmpR family, response regulator MprA
VDGLAARPRVLVVDDDPAIERMLARTLRAEGYEIATASDGGAALASIERWAPDAVVLDVLMPGLDGHAVTRRLREKGDSVPILMLTARDAIEDRVGGLDAGADDYLVKPFATDELTARLRALLRRGGVSAYMDYNNLTVDLYARTAVRGERELSLTGRETALLALLLSRPGQVVTREHALNTVWGGGRIPAHNSVDRYIAYLRAKLGDPELIHTVRGVGFVLRQ